ncbi:MAG TPA: hypothetical protein PLS94_08445, partial [Prolixibacteraceae bacterium]|nr:hypothetical protein [Prolixibacteraceae bacterium]
MKHLFIFMALIAIGLLCNAQNWQKTNSGAKAEVNETQIEIRFFSPEIVQVKKWPNGKSFNKESLSVVKT